MQRSLITLISLFAFACASGDPDAPPTETTYEEIFVSKNDVNRAAVNLDVHAIELRPGESIEAAVRRAGFEPGSMSQLMEEARQAGPQAPESAPPMMPDNSGQCDDTCAHANDGICDDGTSRDGTDVCARGTDCTDCGGLDGMGGDDDLIGAGGADGFGGQGGEGGEGGDGGQFGEGGAGGQGEGGQFGEGGAGGQGEGGQLGEGGAGMPEPAPPEPEAPADPPGNLCNDSCNYAHDGVCDDGRPGAPFSVCARGTDCTDCNQAEGRPAPMPPAEAPAEPESTGQVCVANGQDGVCGPVGDCDGTPVPGFCRGPRSVQCCIAGAANPPAEEAPPAQPQQCLALGRPGVCIDTGACNGTPVPGHCRGASNIQCCVQGEPDPPAGEPEAPATPQQCLAMGRPGVCIPTGDCDGASVPGHCRGAANIQCCVANANPAPQAEPPAAESGEGQSCLASGRPGVCQDTATCQGSSFPGHCNGPDNIRCCVSDAVLEDKAVPIVYAVGVLVVRGGLFFLTRAAPRVAQPALVGTMRQVPGNAQIAMRATNDAMLLAGTATVVGSQVINGEPGRITQDWVESVAQGEVGDNASEDDDTRVYTDARAVPVQCTQPQDLSACVIGRRQRQGQYALRIRPESRGQSQCNDGRREALQTQKNAMCNVPSRCLQLNGNQSAARSASQNLAIGRTLNQPEIEALNVFCGHNERSMHNREQCMGARQQLIDECFPREHGDETHRCEYCAEDYHRQNCFTNHYVAAGCQTFRAIYGN